MTIYGLLSSIGMILLGAQAIAVVALMRRLAPGRTRRPPVAPRVESRDDTSVSLIVPTLNEVNRVGGCLEGLRGQIAPLAEILVVDSDSTDGTPDLVRRAASEDPRIRLISDGPLPPGWIGKVWALESGLRVASGEWVLGLDADTIPAPGLIGAVIAAAESGQYDAVSFSPRFAGQTAAERFVQPAMLVTLIYRTGAAGAEQPADRLLANGQCFLARRETLIRHGGYVAARSSFSDDVTLARHLAMSGLRVGFLDGSRILQVRAYTTLRDMWREWGRSFDLKDSASRVRGWLDLVMVWLVQALPLPMLIMILMTWRDHGFLVRLDSTVRVGLAVVSACAIAIRLSMLWALRGSYAQRGGPYWLSWLADIPAAVRLTLSMIGTPGHWRGREYRSTTSAD